MNYLYNLHFNSRSYPPVVQDHAQYEYTLANHTAALAGWSGVVVTGILLGLGLMGPRRLVVSNRQRQVLASLASQP